MPDRVRAPPSLRELPAEWYEAMVGEWRRRTWFGRLLYPVWLLKSVVQWAALLAFMAFVVYCSIMMRGFEASESSGSGWPEVYKDE